MYCVDGGKESQSASTQKDDHEKQSAVVVTLLSFDDILAVKGLNH